MFGSRRGGAPDVSALASRSSRAHVISAAAIVFARSQRCPAVWTFGDVATVGSLPTPQAPDFTQLGFRRRSLSENDQAVQDV
jgi:hypothetical protein